MEFEKRIEHVKTELLDYPSTLGRCAEAMEYLHGCNVCQYFYDELGFEEPQDIYYILTTSAKKEEYRHLCLESKHCGPIIKKLLDGTYLAKADGGKGDDDIQADFGGTEYRVYEGKHRVCMAKRFGVRTPPIELTIIEDAPIPLISTQSTSLACTPALPSSFLQRLLSTLRRKS